MRIGIISHCAVDTILLNGETHRQVGGDACYSGATAKEFGAAVELQTRFGPDFPGPYLNELGITHDPEAASNSPTTGFRIEIEGMHRELYLVSECEPVPVRKCDTDGTIITPIYHEISPDDAVGHGGHVLLNPQGMLRQAGDGGRIRTERAEINLEGVDTIKVNPQEIEALGGSDGDSGMAALHKGGINTVLRTDGKDISMLSEGRIYSIRLPNKEIHDTTGLGAILCGAFVCTMIKERDPLWALCFAGGAVQAALDTKGMGLLKIPHRGAAQTNASYFYNLVKYRQV